MAEQIRGSHHCIGVGLTTADVVFNFIERHAKTNDGLRPGEIAELRRRFLESYSSGLDYFETVHHKCMNACDRPTNEALTCNTILPTLLAACSKRAAQNAFKVEIGACGASWIDDFFAGFAKYVGEHIYPDADSELVAAFLASAGTHKANLTVETLLQQPKAHAILTRCIRIFSNKKERDARAELISSDVNTHISKVRKIGGASTAKTTSDDVRRFLELMPREAGTAIGPSQTTAVSAA